MGWIPPDAEEQALGWGMGPLGAASWPNHWRLEGEAAARVARRVATGVAGPDDALHMYVGGLAVKVDGEGVGDVT